MKEMLNSPENWVAKRCANRNILLYRRYGVSGVFGVFLVLPSQALITDSAAGD